MSDTEYLNSGNEKPFRKIKSKSERLTQKEIDIVAPFLSVPENFLFIKQNDETIAIPLCFETDLAIIQAALYIKKAGIKLGTIIRNELIPDHELALSNIINENVPAIEVDIDSALTYLRKEEVKSDAGIIGWNLINYQHLALGWIKKLPNRINNYYPKEWRILHK